MVWPTGGTKYSASFIDEKRQTPSICLSVTAVISQKREGRGEGVSFEMDIETLEQLVKPDPGSRVIWEKCP